MSIRSDGLLVVAGATAAMIIDKDATRVKVEAKARSGKVMVKMGENP